MRQKDFIKIIDLKSEYKEYIRFDKGKSSIYKTYAEWDAHMEALLVAIQSQADMYNLKRYCEDAIRSNTDGIQFFWAYLGLSFPLILAFMTEKDIIGFRGFATGFFLISFLFYITCTSKASTRRKHFYEDILRIIKQIDVTS